MTREFCYLAKATRNQSDMLRCRALWVVNSSLTNYTYTFTHVYTLSLWNNRRMYAVCPFSSITFYALLVVSLPNTRKFEKRVKEKKKEKKYNNKIKSLNVCLQLQVT